MPDVLAPGASPVLWVLAWCKHPPAPPLCAERAMGKDGCRAGRPQSSDWRALRGPPTSIVSDGKSQRRGQTRETFPTLLIWGCGRKDFLLQGASTTCHRSCPSRESRSANSLSRPLEPKQAFQPGHCQAGGLPLMLAAPRAAQGAAVPRPHPSVRRPSRPTPGGHGSTAQPSPPRTLLFPRCNWPTESSSSRVPVHTPSPRSARCPHGKDPVCAPCCNGRHLGIGLRRRETSAGPC